MSELLNKIKLNRSTNSINTKYAFIIKNPKSKNVLLTKVRSIHKNNIQKEFEFCLIYTNLNLVLVKLMMHVIMIVFFKEKNLKKSS